MSSLALRFIAIDGAHECFGAVCIVTPEHEPKPIHFVSSLAEIAGRLSRAGKDADAAHSDRFNGAVDE